MLLYTYSSRCELAILQFSKPPQSHATPRALPDTLLCNRSSHTPRTRLGVKLPQRPELSQLLQSKATRNNALKSGNLSLLAGDAQAAIQAHARLSAAAPPLDPKVHATRERAFLPAEAPLPGLPPSLKPPVCFRSAPAWEPELAGHASKQSRV